ncbi:MAG: hypothetical protein KA797_00760 [Chitinophagales bacterium]|nr:hypothetical protein [Chitinophagales bacterium]
MSSMTLQSYAGGEFKNAIGIKGGYGLGLTYKRYFNQNGAFEGILHWFPGSARISALYEFIIPIKPVDNLSFFVGPGAHLGLGPVVWFGMDAIVGIEYQLKEIPVNLSLDWQPGIDIVGGGVGFWGGQGGLAVRYTF